MNSKKFRYDKEDDVLMVWFSKEPVDYAEQEKNLIIHFSKENKPVLMEILDAAKFLKETSKALPEKVKQSIFSPLSIA
ncbi:DUF2283 domain-containing protein [Candidatus Daviesbacteria bacterium]|nr:DUF2283 domain-containing protein [Candidatus Daviesbacteria bacterium]MBI2622490.1 DUF2283 domain-containing protein [Candidatus Levybacteria bacterium]